MEPPSTRGLGGATLQASTIGVGGLHQPAGYEVLVGACRLAVNLDSRGACVAAEWLGRKPRTGDPDVDDDTDRRRPTSMTDGHAAHTAASPLSWARLTDLCSKGKVQ